MNWLSRCDVMWCGSWNEFCWVCLYCNLEILHEICVFFDTVHICKHWVINDSISSIEHNVFDVSVCGLYKCAAQLSVFCWCKASSQWMVGACCFEIHILFWDVWHCPLSDTVPYHRKTRPQLLGCCARIMSRTSVKRNFVVALCISNIKHFIVQLTHTNYKNLRLIKIVKIIKADPTCFGSHITIIREPHPVLS